MLGITSGSELFWNRNWTGLNCKKKCHVNLNSITFFIKLILWNRTRAYRKTGPRTLWRPKTYENSGSYEDPGPYEDPGHCEYPGPYEDPRPYEDPGSYEDVGLHGGFRTLWEPRTLGGPRRTQNSRKTHQTLLNFNLTSFISLQKLWSSFS